MGDVVGPRNWCDRIVENNTSFGVEISYTRSASDTKHLNHPEKTT